MALGDSANLGETTCSAGVPGVRSGSTQSPGAPSLAMPKYVSVKVRAELVEMLKRCRRPGEPLSDTFKYIIDPVLVSQREAEALGREKAGKVSLAQKD